MVLPAMVGVMVTSIADERLVAHTPELTVLLNQVVAVNAPGL